MDDFTKIKQKIAAAQVNPGRLPEAYCFFWERIVFVTVAQRREILQLLEPFNRANISAPGWFLFSESECLIFESNYVAAIEKGNEAYEYFRSMADDGGCMATLSMTGVAYRSVGLLDKAGDCLQRACTIAAGLDRESMYLYFAGISFYQLGELNLLLKKYPKALECFWSGLKIQQEPAEFKARFLNGLGNAYVLTGEWEMALDHFNQALAVIANTNNYMAEARIYSDLGNYYLKRNDLPAALLNQQKSLDIRMAHNLVNPAIGNYLQLAEIHFLQKNMEQAEQFGRMALEQAEKIKANIRIYESHRILSNIYESTGQTEKAFFHFKEFHYYNQEVFNQEAVRRTEEANSRHKIETMQQEKEIFRLRNVELKSALDEITDSIRYARRIQQSLLPPIKQIEKMLTRVKGN